MIKIIHYKLRLNGQILKNIYKRTKKKNQESKE